MKQLSKVGAWVSVIGGVMAVGLVVISASMGEGVDRNRLATVELRVGEIRKDAQFISLHHQRIRALEAQQGEASRKIEAMRGEMHKGFNDTASKLGRISGLIERLVAEEDE